jgi:Domain of unknown function (DUF6894)
MSDRNPTSESIYFFRVFTNDVGRHETEGLVFASKEDAWQEATNSTGEIIRDMDGNMHPGMDWRMDVTNAAGTLIYRLSFKAEEF